MALVLMDDVMRPTFNATYGTDVGPGTAHQIRYSIADYKKLISKWVDDPSVYRIGGPISMDYAAKYGPLEPAGSFSSTGATFLLKWNVGNTFDTEQDPPSFVDDFPACPYADGVSDPREGAFLTNQVSVSAQLSLDLRFPRCEQSDWSTCTDVWLTFALDASNTTDQGYVCDPSGDHGDSPGTLTSNFLGVDDVGGALFPGYDHRTPIGDGTMYAYFAASLGVGSDQVIYSNLVTRAGL